MARVRKSSDRTNQACARWNAACYIRLSREDGNDESYSIKNQRQRLMGYLDNPMLAEEVQLIGCYIDDGYTGTDSDREGFQRMLGDIDKGIVNCVIVKDLSRLSRNDWECKKYLQQFFVVKNVRFISLELPQLDSHQNPDEVYELGVSIQSMYNENHCRETSIKVRGTLNMKRKRGEFIGAFAPYGYQKDPADKHCLIVDHEVADIVRDIFDWFVRDGMSKNGIVKRLIGLGIPCPSAYKRSSGMNYQNPSMAIHAPVWSARSISAILTNQMYLGHMVQGKQKVKSYQVHARVSLPEHEWFIVEHTHEPIIEQDIFDQAQELLHRDTRTAPQSRQLYPFSGFLRCADCGRSMGRRTSKNIVYYACRTHSTTGLCSRHSIRHDKLERAVLETIQTQVALIDDMAQLIDDIHRTSVPCTGSKRLTASIKHKKHALERVSSARTGLYLDWKNGDITREEYHNMKQELEEQEQKLKQELAALTEEHQAIGQGGPSSHPYVDAFCKYHNLSSLDRGMVAQLIKTIDIHEGGGITIQFSFADQYRGKMALMEPKHEASTAVDSRAG